MAEIDKRDFDFARIVEAAKGIVVLLEPLHYHEREATIRLVECCDDFNRATRQLMELGCLVAPKSQQAGESVLSVSE